MNLEKAYTYIDSHEHDMISLWRSLVNVNSGSYSKDGVDEVGRRIAEFLKANGIPSRFYQNERRGNMLVAEYGDMRKPYILFLGHMDTVFKDGTAEERPFTIRDGMAFGPGVLDMKGGITIALFVMKLAKELGYTAYPIKLILAGDEEIGHLSSEAVSQIHNESVGAVAAFNFETGFPDNSIVVERKGTLRAILNVSGIGAHAGNNPQDGRSAIKEMAHKILALEELTDLKKGNTVNVGVIKGGTVANAVPEYCEIVVDVRFVDESSKIEYMKRIHEIASRIYIPGTSTVVSFPMIFDAMSRSEATMALFKKVNDIVIKAGFAPFTAKAVGGGSDSAHTVAMGVPTLCAMGVQGTGNHTIHEQAEVASLFTRTKSMLSILEHIRL